MQADAQTRQLSAIFSNITLMKLLQAEGWERHSFGIATTLFHATDVEIYCRLPTPRISATLCKQ